MAQSISTATSIWTTTCKSTPILRPMGGRLSHKLIVVDGLDGTGKTATIAAVARMLRRSGRTVLSVNYCKGDFAGCFRQTRDYASATSRYLLQIAAFSHMMDEISNVNSETIVLCDRYIHSAHAYYLALPASERSFAPVATPMFPPAVKVLLTCSDTVRRARLFSRRSSPSHRKLRTLTRYGASILRILRQLDEWTELDNEQLSINDAARCVLTAVNLGLKI